MEKYDITGMSCAACAAHVEKAVSRVQGVNSCAVNLLQNTLTVDGTALREDVQAAVIGAGYGVGKADKSEKSVARSLILSAVLLVILMYISMGHTMWGFPIPYEEPFAMAFAELALALAVGVINRRFFISGAKAALHGAPNMDTLVALGSFSSFAYSVYAVVKAALTADAAAMNGSLYFESSAMILTLVTVGKLLEEKSKKRSTGAIAALKKLAPETATVERDGKEENIGIEELACGDIFVIKPGDRIPADGEVIYGKSDVDESALTGESIPVPKAEGDTVMSASINTAGFMKCRATRVGSDTTLSGIIRMVSDASGKKAPIARIADKVAGVFVPSVLGIALVTLVCWLIAGKEFAFALSCAVAVLVISCPCALGLATPVAITVAHGVGAKNGILFKSAAAVETAGRVRTAVFDKTGTITKGMPEVTDTVEYLPCLMSVAASLEAKSEHPLAKAVVAYAAGGASDAKDFTAYSGAGVAANVDGAQCVGGNYEFVSRFAKISDEAKGAAERFAAEGKTPLYFARGGELAGIIAAADAVREDSAAAIARFHKMGVRTVMLTGDNEKTARTVAKAVGVSEVIAGVLPADKEKKVAELCRDDKTAMVGDGINDAPALTRADIGIAIGAGTDIAIESADIVLMKSSLSDAASAVKLGRATLANIKENLFWAFFYNVICIPLAAGLLYPSLGIRLSPMIGAAAMSVSSLCVVFNALRLNLFSAEKKQKEKKMEKTFEVKGMMCAHCEATVKSALEAVPGVQKASADHSTGKVSVTFAPTVTEAALKKAITDKGYEVK